MNTKSKMMAAILAVAIMLGCAFVPLAVGDTEQAKAESSDDLGDFTFEALIEQIKEQGSNIKELVFSGVMLVPTVVDTEGYEKTVIDDIEGHRYVQPAQSAIIKDNNHTFSPKDGHYGRLVVHAGGELVIFGEAKNEQHEIKFTNANGREEGVNNSVIIMESGSILTIFGASFLVVSTSHDAVNLLSFERSGVGTRDMSVTFSYNIDLENNVVFSMKVNEYFTVVTVAEVGRFFGHFGQTDDPDFEITGKSELGTSGYKFSNGVLYLNMRQGSHYYNMSLSVPEFSVFFTVSEDLSEISSTVNISLKMTDEQHFEYTREHSEQGMVISDNAVIKGLEFLVKDLTFDLKMNLGSDAGFEVGVSFDEFSLEIKDALASSHTNAQNPVWTILYVYDIGFTFAGDSFVVDVEFDEEGMSTVDTKVKGNFEFHLGKIRGYIGDEAGYMTWDHTLVTDLSLVVPNIDLEYKNGTGTCTVGDIVLSGTVPKDKFVLSDYEISFAATVTGLTATVSGDDSVTTFGMAFAAKASMDGIERTIVAHADDIAVVTKNGAVKATIDELVIINHMPKEVLRFDVPANSEIRVFNAVMTESGLVAERAFLAMGENGLFDSFFMEMEDNVSIDVEMHAMNAYYDISCGNVKGYFANVGKDIVRFGIDDGAQLEIATTTWGMNSIYIEKGNAYFNGGKLPFYINVMSGASFHANGLVARGFGFAEGSVISGTVCIDTEFSQSSNIVIGENRIHINAVPSENRDYVLTMDLNTKNSGTIEAKKGCLFPTAYSSEGFYMRSDDQKTGTFTVDSGEVKVKIPMGRESYTLSFENNFAPSETHKYGESVTLPTETPTKEGCEFYGWTDGTGAVYLAGETYTMPARDVTLTPMFAKYVEPTVVSEGGKKIAVIDAGDADAVNVMAPKSDYDSFRVTTNGTTVEFSKAGFEKMVKGQESPVLILETNMVYSFGNDFEEYDGEIALYNVTIRDEDLNPVTNYDGDTEFKVTFTVFAGSGANDFNVMYVDSYGHAHEVKLDGYKDVGNGYYEVTFYTNHFSNYLVTFNYGSEVNGTIAVIIGIAVALILIFGIVLTYQLRKSKG